MLSIIWGIIWGAIKEVHVWNPLHAYTQWRCANDSEKIATVCIEVLNCVELKESPFTIFDTSRIKLFQFCLGLIAYGLVCFGQNRFKSHRVTLGYHPLWIRVPGPVSPSHPQDRPKSSMRQTPVCCPGMARGDGRATTSGFLREPKLSPNFWGF